MPRQDSTLLTRLRTIDGRVTVSRPGEEREGIKGRKLSLDEINHYMKVARVVQLTIGLQGKVDEVYLRIG